MDPMPPIPMPSVTGASVTHLCSMVGEQRPTDPAFLPRAYILGFATAVAEELDHVLRTPRKWTSHLVEYDPSSELVVYRTPCGEDEVASPCELDDGQPIDPCTTWAMTLAALVDLRKAVFRDDTDVVPQGLSSPQVNAWTTREDTPWSGVALDLLEGEGRISMPWGVPLCRVTKSSGVLSPLLMVPRRCGFYNVNLGPEPVVWLCISPQHVPLLHNTLATFGLIPECGMPFLHPALYIPVGFLDNHHIPYTLVMQLPDTVIVGCHGELWSSTSLGPQASITRYYLPPEQLRHTLLAPFDHLHEEMNGASLDLMYHRDMSEKEYKQLLAGTLIVRGPDGAMHTVGVPDSRETRLRVRQAIAPINVERKEAEFAANKLRRGAALYTGKSFDEHFYLQYNKSLGRLVLDATLPDARKLSREDVRNLRIPGRVEHGSTSNRVNQANLFHAQVQKLRKNIWRLPLD